MHQLFLLISCWLTVAMAVYRYLAICHPLLARQYLGMSASRGIIIAVFCLSTLFNLPRFWTRKIMCYNSTEGGRTYFNIHGYMHVNGNKYAYMTFTWLYFILGIFIPLLVLGFCTIYFNKALREWNLLRPQHSNSSKTEGRRVVTLTFYVIVIC